MESLSINVSKLTVGVKNSISRKTTFFSYSPFSRGKNLFSFHCSLIWSELNYIVISVCSKELDFIFLLNRIFVYSLPDAMSSLTGNHTMDLFYVLPVEREL